MVTFLSITVSLAIYMFWRDEKIYKKTWRGDIDSEIKFRVYQRVTQIYPMLKKKSIIDYLFIFFDVMRDR